MTNATIDALMRDYAWTVHDFQHLANSMSLLVSAIGVEDFDERNFYADVEVLTMAAPENTRHAAVLNGLSNDEKAVLTRLKKARDRVMHTFFVEHRIDRDNAEAVAEQAREKLTSLRRDVKNGRVVLDRAYALLAEVGGDD